MLASKLEQSKRQYAQDLRTLRKYRGVSLETISTETRIIKTVLEEFEINCLHQNSRFNKVYLCSLCRAYARVAGLDVDQVVSALEMALEGKYDGRLDPNYKAEEKSSKTSSKGSSKPSSKGSSKSSSKPVSKPSAKKSASTSAPSKGASPPKPDKRTRGG